METLSLIPPSSSSFKKDVMGKLEALGAPVSVSCLRHTSFRRHLPVLQGTLHHPFRLSPGSPPAGDLL